MYLSINSVYLSGGDSYETESDDLAIVEAEVSHNTEVEILVKSLAVRFNNQHEDLFQATMLNYSSMMVLSPDIFSINGELGNFCIKARVYKVRLSGEGRISRFLWKLFIQIA